MYRFLNTFLLFSLFFITNSFAEEDKYAPVKDRLATCVACHGEKGVSAININPSLAGQHFYYIYTQLKDFHAGRRENAIMAPMIAGLEKDQMKLIAEYFSKEKWSPVKFKASKEQTKIALSVINSGQCVACHLGGFEGNSRVPRLSGQHFEYLEKTMIDFKNKVRNNAPSKGSLFATYSEEELSAVAAYLSGFKE
ncbi:MAG: cytochrome c4 [Gammaproteobacteria bacterium]|nr:cytochrome c4 [Gammaproteobacteria bacterium]